VLSARQVEQALYAQVMWGGRLGTNLVELHMLDLDVLSRIIAKQHGLPAAFATHFEAADPDLQTRLSPELAAQYACVPLRRLAGDRIVLASIAPLDGRARALVADQLGISYKGLVPSIAAELRIHYNLERVYGIPRETRFLRSRQRSKVPSFEIQLDPPGDDSGPIAFRAPEPVVEQPISDAIPEELLPDFTPRIELDEPAGVERRHYLQTLNDDAAPLGRIEIKRHALGSAELAAAKPPATLDEATLAIRRSTDRCAIAHRVVDAVERFGPARAMLLVVRGDAATDCEGEIAVPIGPDRPNLVAAALRDQTVARAPADNPVDAKLLDALGVPDGDLVIAPIKIGAHVWSLIAVATASGAAVDGLEPIASAAAVAFARLLRNANR
jgi:hypothetical protein